MCSQSQLSFQTKYAFGHHPARQTLEVNDFRHRLKESYESSSVHGRPGHRYVASLVAVRYGLRDALIDWFVVYSIGYAIVAGLTWTNVSPDSLYVIWGFSRIFSAAILAYTAIKVPQWVSCNWWGVSLAESSASRTI